MSYLNNSLIFYIFIAKIVILRLAPNLAKLEKLNKMNIESGC